MKEVLIQVPLIKYLHLIVRLDKMSNIMHLFKYHATKTLDKVIKSNKKSRLK